jgi:hypothetical protein
MMILCKIQIRLYYRISIIAFFISMKLQWLLRAGKRLLNEYYSLWSSYLTSLRMGRSNTSKI